MTDISELKIGRSEIVAGLRIKVSGLRSFGIRMRVSAFVMRLAGWIAKLPIEVDVGRYTPRIEELPDDEKLIDRRAGCVYVSTHCEIDASGTKWRTWQRIPIKH